MDLIPKVMEAEYNTQTKRFRLKNAVVKKSKWDLLSGSVPLFEFNLSEIQNFYLTWINQYQPIYVVDIGRCIVEIAYDIKNEKEIYAALKSSGKESKDNVFKTFFFPMAVVILALILAYLILVYLIKNKGLFW
ncbi:hypothetical protein BVX98_00695 [bacterium F11]|nr:hypothetical protein BVX98_00695 [bacterium F11]